MTKVVINRCHGGFGLSNEAFELLLQRKGIEFETLPSKYPLGDQQVDYYHKGHAGEEKHFISDYDFYDERDDADLVAIVEELGEKANGWAANLAIVEIPDDIIWYVEEYDGQEWVAESHRTWR
jgi:hypothetical protein